MPGGIRCPDGGTPRPTVQCSCSNGRRYQPWREVLPGEDPSSGSGLFMDLIPTTREFTNIRSCMRPAGWDRVKTLVMGRAG